jgi:hypothetical protein
MRIGMVRDRTGNTNEGKGNRSGYESGRRRGALTFGCRGRVDLL